MRPPRTGGGSRSAPKPKPDFRGLWENYRQWIGEAGERYERDVERIGRMPGLGEEARTSELETRRGAYEEELAGFRRGSTYRQLRQEYRDRGSRGSLEDYFGGKYGQYQPAEPAAAGVEAAETAGARPRGSGVGTEADVAGLGAVRPWWAL